MQLNFNAIDNRAEDPGGLTAAEVKADRRQAAPNNLRFDADEYIRQQRLGLHVGQRDVVGSAGDARVAVVVEVELRGGGVGDAESGLDLLVLLRDQGGKPVFVGDAQPAAGRLILDARLLGPVAVFQLGGGVAVALGEGADGALVQGWISRTDLAQELGVCEETLRRWADARRGPAFVKAGRKILYRRTAVLDWLEAQEVREPRRARSGGHR